MSWVVIVAPQYNEKGRVISWRGYTADSLAESVLRPLWAEGRTAKETAGIALREISSAVYMQGGEWKPAPPIEGIYRETLNGYARIKEVN